MTGFIALTNWEWFQFLRNEPNLDEANFWRPSDVRTPKLEPFTPIIFKLNAAHGGWIVGFGLFASHTVKPMWSAWEAFERRNGAPTMSALHATLSRIRNGKGLESDSAGNYLIGNLMLSAPTFFRETDWIPPPSDWPRSGVMQGMGYDLTQGEGARVWHECQLVARAVGLGPESTDTVAEPQAHRYGDPVLVRPRLGQGSFRMTVTDAYGSACAVTTEHSLPVLEAAHIRPYSIDGPHEVSNGLLLRTDIHRLFDKGYVTVTPDYRFKVSRRLRDDYDNGKIYYAMDGTQLRVPDSPADRPRPEHLEWHGKERFKG